MLQIFSILIGSATKLYHLCPDIWCELFQYFKAIELYVTFTNITNAANEVLFNRKYHIQLRGLVIDGYCIENLSKHFQFDQVISLTIKNTTNFDIIKQCSQLLSLKLIGDSKWIILQVKKCFHINTKLEQLVIVMPEIKCLYELLECILPIDSLRRLEIRVDQLEEKVKPSVLFKIPSKIEQFILHSSSPINWSDLKYLQSGLVHIRLLEISLLHGCKKVLSPLILPCLRSLRIILLEVSFECIIEIVTIMPNLVKLRLNGLVDDENFLMNQKWIHLLESTPCLTNVAVNLSFQKSASSCCPEELQVTLRDIHLNLTWNHDDCSYYSNSRNEDCWWQLVGVIIKQHCERV